MMYVPKSIKRRKSFIKLAKLDPSGSQLLQHITTNIHSYMSGPSIKDIIKVCGMVSNPHEFRASIAKILTANILTKTKPTYNCLGNEIPQVLEAYSKYMNKEQRNSVIDHLINNADMFYPYSRKKAVKVIADLIGKGDERAFSTLITFLKVIENDSLEKLLSKIEGGLNNPDVQTILAKTKVLSYTKYDETKVKSDPEIRRALIKEIANTQSIAKKIPFEVEVSLEDIKAIAPAARLNFLEFAFKPEIILARRMSKSTYWYGKHGSNIADGMASARSRAKLGKLKMPKLDLETVKELLFSVSLQKNEEMTAWVAGYSTYLDVMDGKSKPISKSGYNYY